MIFISYTYGNKTVYIIGDSKTAINNAITHQYNAFYLAIIVDMENEVIVDAGASVTLQVTNEFIRSLFVGYSMKQGLEPMIDRISHRYFGASQKAIIVAWKDAFKKYQQIISSNI